MLRLLEPKAAVGYAKIRLGNVGDGGYVSLDDFRSGDIALSLGINDDISWDLDTADRGLTIYQFDHTVDDPAPHDPRMIFHKKMIGTHNDWGTQRLADLVHAHDKREARPNLVLKIDIESSEWPVWDDMTKEELGRFSQILCEIHSLNDLGNLESRRRIHRCLQKLHRNYAVIHVHGNVCGGITNIGNVIFPSVLEVSFANRSCYDFVATDELFPTSLDASCDANAPDMFLGAFRF